MMQQLNRERQEQSQEVQNAQLQSPFVEYDETQIEPKFYKVQRLKPTFGAELLNEAPSSSKRSGHNPASQLSHAAVNPFSNPNMFEKLPTDNPNPHVRRMVRHVSNEQVQNKDALYKPNHLEATQHCDYVMSTAELNRDHKMHKKATMGHTPQSQAKRQFYLKDEDNYSEDHETLKKTLKGL